MKKITMYIFSIGVIYSSCMNKCKISDRTCKGKCTNDTIYIYNQTK